MVYVYFAVGVAMDETMWTHGRQVGDGPGGPTESKTGKVSVCKGKDKQV